MLFDFGEHTGKSVELVVLKEPKYVRWMMKKTEASGPLLKARIEAKRLLVRFDNKPIKIKCNAAKCTCRATRLSVYGSELLPVWWCDNCDPYQYAANIGMLNVIRTYADVLNHVTSTCAKRVDDYRELIKVLAQAKGLPSRVGEKQAAAFFE